MEEFAGPLGGRRCRGRPDETGGRSVDPLRQKSEGERPKKTWMRSLKREKKNREWSLGQVTTFAEVRQYWRSSGVGAVCDPEFKVASKPVNQ